MKILIAEDELNLHKILKTVLERENYSVDSAYNGIEALKLAENNFYDIIVLDIMMPKMDGITTLKELRAQGNTSHIIMTTALGEEENKIDGLDNGADDYITKPYSVKELLARLRAMKRRQSEEFSPTELNFGNITLNTLENELISNNSVRLSARESKLLEFLLLNKDKEIYYEQILNHVWRDKPKENYNTVNFFVSFLNDKLKSIGSNVIIIENNRYFSINRR